MEFQDKVLRCEGCKKEFTHTAEEQRKFAEKEFRFEPRRCPECREARKAKKNRGRGYTAYGLAPVGDSGNWGGRGGDRSSRGGGGGFRSGGGHRDRGEGGGGGYGESAPRQSFDAVCAACGAKTTVPFEPTQGRDVYCRECFQKRKSGGSA